MQLTKRRLKFLKAARHRDPRMAKYHAMWCLKKYRTAMAVNGFIMHAVPIQEPSCTFAFRAIEGANKEQQFSLMAVDESDAPKIDIGQPGPILASMWINPMFLRRSLEALGNDPGNSVKLSIHRAGKKGQALAISGDHDNIGAFYALIMGMYRDPESSETWSPWSENDDFHPPLTTTKDPGTVRKA